MAKEEIRSRFDIRKQDLLDILDKFFRRYETKNLFNGTAASTWKDLKAEPVPGARIFVRATEPHLEGEYTLFRDARIIALEVSPHKVEVVLLFSTRAEREAARQDQPSELRAQRMVVPDAIADFAFAPWNSLETLYRSLVDYIREELSATGEQSASTETATIEAQPPAPADYSKARKPNTGEWIALAGLVFVILTCIAAWLVVPEVRAIILSFVRGATPTSTPALVFPTATP